ncbi:hypothetical protein CDV57_03895 [Aspergillus fumigatus]|nr:hypothetical protein CDV57_03895 [Aspergillus fumigatus]
MEPKVFKGEPTHVFRESYIDPDKLLKRMAEKYRRGNFCIKLRCGIYSIYLLKEVEDQEFVK